MFPSECKTANADGWKRVDEIQPNEWLLSRSEFDPDGPLAWKQVEEKFERTGRILGLTADSREIDTTPEHPFWVKGMGWTQAGALHVGDEIRTDSGWATIDEVRDTGVYEKVYNLRVADWHTYFVGEEAWGWAAWAHNTYIEITSTDRIVTFDRQCAALTMARVMGNIPKSLQPMHVYRFVNTTIGLGESTEHGIPVTTLQTSGESGEWLEFFIPGIGYRYIVHHPRAARAGNHTSGVGHYHVGQSREGPSFRLDPNDAERRRYHNLFDNVKWEHIAYARP